jgi:transposase
MLTYKAELVGLQVVASKVSSTSQASFLDGDPLPVYAPARPLPIFSARRFKRGRYCTIDARRLNADVNGAFNMMRKGVPDAFGDGIGGVVLQPGQDCPGEWAAW